MDTRIGILKIPVKEAYNSDGIVGDDELTERLLKAGLIIENIISMSILVDQIVIFYKR